ncbi:MAG: replication initiation factor domain-containing protein [Gammaproteobacteria bacterium]|nr:replication initiation factor domain-containing protein [Gammaproteobacteria bacterium]
MGLKGDHAFHIAFLISQSTSNDWASQCLGYLRDFIDFIGKGDNDTNITRARLLPWWKLFIGSAEKLKLSTKKEGVVDITAKLKSYLDRLLPTLYIAKHGLGINLNTEVEKAASRLKDFHQLKLKRIKEASGEN